MEKPESKARPGRPPLFDEAMGRFNVMLSRIHRQHLQDIGSGNVSEGIRRLLQWHEGLIEKP